MEQAFRIKELEAALLDTKDKAKEDKNKQTTMEEKDDTNESPTEEATFEDHSFQNPDDFASASGSIEEMDSEEELEMTTDQRQTVTNDSLVLLNSESEDDLYFYQPTSPFRGPNNKRSASRGRRTPAKKITPHMTRYPFRSRSQGPDMKIND